MHARLIKLHRRVRRQQQAHAMRFRRFRAHPVMVPIVTFAVLLLVSLGGWWLLARDDTPVTDAYVVIITHDHAEQTVPSREPTVGALLKKLNLTLNEGDVVEPSAQTKIKQDDFRINIYRAVPIEIIDGTQHTFTFSAATTSRSIARQAGIATYAEDNLTIKPVDNFVSQEAIGEQVVIDRATPININLYGTPTVVRTHAKTVADLMKEKGIKLAKDDQVTPALSTPLVDNQQLFVTRNGTKIESVTESIPAPTQAIDDPTLAFGTSAIRQQGSDGQQITTYQDALQNGVVVSRTLIQTVVTQQPVTQIAVRGTSLSGIRGDMALAGVSPDDYEAADYIISHESGWCTTKAQGEHDCPVVPDNQFTSGGYGLCQATPGNKMSSAGADWATNPITQIRWCSGYAAGRYGGWSGAYNHWLNYHNW